MWPAPRPTAYEEGELPTRHGPVAYRWYAAPGSRCGAIWVGGAGGGWDTPAGGLYPRLSEELTNDGINSLRVRFRNPLNLAEAVIDVRAGVGFCAARGVDALALAGHSFGGAVVIRAAVQEPAVRTVVALATQSYGAESVAQLGPARSILLIHGLDDEVLPWRSSKFVYDMAAKPKRIIYVADARHGLEEAAEDVRRVVRDWIINGLHTAVR
jgi:pimeloyl-ACP methyl ester carboxylesterase